MSDYWPHNLPMSPDYPEKTLYGTLQEICRTHGERTALIFGEDSLRYRELKEFADRFAVLASEHLRTGDRMVILMRNCPQFVFTLYGALKAGALVVPVSHLMKKDEIENIINDCDPGLVVCERSSQHLVSGREMYTTDPLDFLERDREDLMGVLSGMDPLEVEDREGKNGLLMYTSGTTDRPKGVVLTHRNVIVNGVGGGLWTRKDDRDVSLCALPLSHILGLVEGLFGSIVTGSTMVVLPQFSSEAALRSIENHGCTIMTGVPPMFKAIAKNAKGYDLSSLRVCFSGGAPLDERDAEEFSRATGCPLIEGYGLTESTAQLTINPVERPKKGSAGIPIFDVHTKVISLESGRELGRNEEGELCFRGPQVMDEYWRDPERTKKTLSGGWLHTGDTGYMDKEGYIFITGRVDDIINISGYKVNPEEVERVIMKNRAIKECSVVGVKDFYGKERVKAFVVLKEDMGMDEKSIKMACREKLADYKCPHIFEFSDSLPKSAGGKVLRRSLRGEP